MTQTFLKKYAPKKFEDFILKDDMIYFIKSIIQTQNINILINGKIGSGKTTMINLILNTYYKNIENYETNIMNINCLKEQGIQYYRNEVKNFCQTKSSITGKKKVLILDDIDDINEQSQQIFRNYIDKYTDNVIFITSCCDINKVNEHILCRLFIIKLSSITNEKLSELCDKIIKEEQLQISDTVKNDVIKLSNNSFRNLLCNLEKIKLADIVIDDSNIYKVCSNVNFNHYKDYTIEVLNGKLKNACNIIKSICDEGYSISDIFYFYFIFLKHNNDVNEIQKMVIIKNLCKYIGLINNNYEDDIELVIFTNNIIKSLGTTII